MGTKCSQHGNEEKVAWLEVESSLLITVVKSFHKGFVEDSLVVSVLKTIFALDETTMFTIYRGVPLCLGFDDGVQRKRSADASAIRRAGAAEQ